MASGNEEGKLDEKSMKEADIVDESSAIINYLYSSEQDSIAETSANSHNVPTSTDVLQQESLQLTDGSTAYIQSLSAHLDGQNVAVQLEDGTTAFIRTTHNDGLQAVQLQDGTTAYISHALDLEEFTTGVLDSVQNVEINSIALTKSQAASSIIRSGGSRVTKSSNLGDKVFRCTYEGCERLYTTQHHLKVHERTHTGDRPFKCSSCKKTFATGYSLKSHTRVHTGEKPYKCTEFCGKGFKTSGDLQKHLRTHTGERPFKCLFSGCDRAFTTSNIRKVHMRIHTGERPYVCPVEGCERTFASATNYKNHIRIHTGEKPYVCEVKGCGKKFTEYSSLYKHNVVHTPSKPYACDLCGRNYRQTSTLSMHRRSAHGILDASSISASLSEENNEMEDQSETEENDQPERIQVMLVNSNGDAQTLQVDKNSAGMELSQEENANSVILPEISI